MALGGGIAYEHPDVEELLVARIVTVWRRRWPVSMRSDGHYDVEADIAWVRFENYDPHTAALGEAPI